MVGMKEKYQNQLREDFNKYCKQLGIFPGEIPRLIIDRKEMNDFHKSIPYDERKGNARTNDGLCYFEQRVIYVNIGIRRSWTYPYKGVKYTKRQITPHKTTYRDLQFALAHELVHYRFPKMNHGKKFELTTRALLRGQTFPQVVLHKKEKLPIPAIQNTPLEPVTDFNTWIVPKSDVDIEYPDHEHLIGSTYIPDEDDRSECRIQETQKGIYFDFKYKELDIEPRNKFIPTADATLGAIITELMRPDKQFIIGDKRSHYVLRILKDFAHLDEKEPQAPIDTTEPLLEYDYGYKIGDTERKIYSVDGFRIASDKCAYVCQKCKAVYQSKTLFGRTMFHTKDPRCKTCDHGFIDLKKVCECPDLATRMNREY
ncbi:MAG TPA: hypothetical protein VKA95_03085 [Nitrososphaeraceae archaeon]|nr:hypothetical protein [Nitrososphaeraceae archaeon]